MRATAFEASCSGWIGRSICAAPAESKAQAVTRDKADPARLRDEADRAEGEILLLADGTGTTRDHRARERVVLAIAERLAASRIEGLPARSISQEVSRLDRELEKAGGRLSSEQRQAIELGCGQHRLVVIEGHAGTGKSTTLTGIARTHEVCGQEIVVTSTAALAAERLAAELAERGASCAAYSTAGLHRAITSGRLQLGPETTVIHDEAVLASTREQLQLLRHVEESGARLIEVGDPRQNQPVGAGGLWPEIENATAPNGARVELTVNQRARDPADRQAQAWFREGLAELAIHSYAVRGRVHLHADQQSAEDQALEAAHHDRTAGKTTLVLAQTSNEHLDELNARAQAIRHQHRQLGQESLQVPGRPYSLQPGDLVQVRHTIPHPAHGQLRNGTTATIASVDPHIREVGLELADGTRVRLTEEQLAEADLRLAYVQHPFPAQGHTTDTAHLIIAGHATRQGSYVALTRARLQTHIYAPETPEPPADHDRLKELADRISRTEPEVPSIQTPLSHENTIRADAELAGTDGARRPQQRGIEAHAGERTEETLTPDSGLPPLAEMQLAGRENPRDLDTPALEELETDAEPCIDRTTDEDTNLERDQARVWPRLSADERSTPAHEADRDGRLGWEP